MPTPTNEQTTEALIDKLSILDSAPRRIVLNELLSRTVEYPAMPLDVLDELGTTFDATGRNKGYLDAVKAEIDARTPLNERNTVDLYKELLAGNIASKRGQVLWAEIKPRLIGDGIKVEPLERLTVLLELKIDADMKARIQAEVDRRADQHEKELDAAQYVMPLGVEQMKEEILGGAEKFVDEVAAKVVQKIKEVEVMGEPLVTTKWSEDVNDEEDNPGHKKPEPDLREVAAECEKEMVVESKKEFPSFKLGPMMEPGTPFVVDWMTYDFSDYLDKQVEVSYYTDEARTDREVVKGRLVASAKTHLIIKIPSATMHIQKDRLRCICRPIELPLYSPQVAAYVELTQPARMGMDSKTAKTYEAWATRKIPGEAFKPITPVEQYIKGTVAPKQDPPEHYYVGGVDFVSVEEDWREYDFGNGKVVRIENPQWLNVKRQTATVHSHRLIDENGVSHYIPGGWIHLSWKAPENMEFQV